MQSDPKCTIDAANFCFHYITEQNVCYICVCDAPYPKKLAFAYLEEIQREFQANYGERVDQATRPYEFIKFGTFF